jgi:carbon-monoxide dehydrogenase medium subunit
MIAYDYHQPGSLEEAFLLNKDHPGSLYISGGTDLMVRIHKKELQPHDLISLRSIPSLSGIDNGNSVRIGAMTTVSELTKNSQLQERYPALIQAANTLGSVQIRNVATIGGNLCNGSPAADLALPLLVLHAKVRLQSGKTRRDVPLDKFFRGPGETGLSPGEILTDILLEAPEKNAKSIFLKKGRTKMDLALASAAVLITTDGSRCSEARVAVGSVAPTPVRLSIVEEILIGAALSRGLLDEAQKRTAESVSPISDVRSTADYRRHLAGVLVRRALELLTHDQFGDRYRI